MRAPRILLIRADQATHDALRRRLERRGCQVFEAGTQRKAVQAARLVHPDLLVQEETVALDDPAALDAVISAIEVLAGPLPGRPRATRPAPRRTHARARRGGRAAGGAALAG
jgi:hypothetical protein